VQIKGKNYTWTSPVCDLCWIQRYAERDPIKIKEQFRSHEVCVFCGDVHRSGIYERIDPRTVPYPKLEDE
jgi:hypothetical protein